MKKKILVLLTLVMTFAAVPAFAAEAEQSDGYSCRGGYCDRNGSCWDDSDNYCGGRRHGCWR